MNVTFQKLDSSTYNSNSISNMGQHFFLEQNFFVCRKKKLNWQFRKTQFLDFFFKKQKKVLLDPHENQSQICDRMDETQF